MINYFLDTNVFDFLLDNNINIESLKTKGYFYTSNIQKSEILNIKNSDRRKKLMNIYLTLNQKKVSLKSGIWLDDLYWDDEQKWIDIIGEIPTNWTKNSEKKSWKDALIAEIAKTENFVVISNDNNFIKKAKVFCIKIFTSIEFINNT